MKPDMWSNIQAISILFCYNLFTTQQKLTWKIARRERKVKERGHNVGVCEHFDTRPHIHNNK